MTAAGRPTVEFYYCCSCPWSYLALIRLHEAVLRTGAAIDHRPIISAWIDDGVGPPVGSLLTSADPNVLAYARKDLKDWARFCGVTIELPSERPAEPVWAQRGAVVAIDSGVVRQYLDATFQALFAAGRNIGDRTTVLDVAAECGLSGDDFEAKLASDEVLDTIRRNTERLGQRGGFASPTMFLGDDMYFGHERIPLLEGALMRAGDRPFIAPGEHDR